MKINFWSRKFLSFLSVIKQLSPKLIVKALLGTLFLKNTKELYKGIIIFLRNFHEKFYIVCMNMNTSVQGRPSLPQCITFQSLLFLKKF